VPPPPPPPNALFCMSSPPVPKSLVSGPISSTSGHNILFWDIGKGYGPLPVVDKSIYSAEYQRLCALLRELRHGAGLTQAQVAERLDEPQSFVSKYEAGERRLDVVELHQVASALQSSVVAILRQLWPDS
jgi:hypothetical protein